MAGLTRKHFKMFAEEISKAKAWLGREVAEKTMYVVAQVLRRENSRFDTDRFFAACLGETRVPKKVSVAGTKKEKIKMPVPYVVQKWIEEGLKKIPVLPLAILSNGEKVELDKVFQEIEREGAAVTGYEFPKMTEPCDFPVAYRVGKKVICAYCLDDHLEQAWATPVPEWKPTKFVILWDGGTCSACLKPIPEPEWKDDDLEQHILHERVKRL